MHKLYSFTIALLLLLTSCNKDTIDGNSLYAFQTSVNDISSNLNTLQQIKFREALYIIKKYGTTANTPYMQKMDETAKLIDGKNAAQILKFADSIALANHVEWSSTGTPSLGEMNIFDPVKAKERDPNDITAAALQLSVVPTRTDSAIGPTQLKIIPRLVDEKGNNISFHNATLETVLTITSGGHSLLTARNFMTNNQFKGFYVDIPKLSASKIENNHIDVNVHVKTTSKTFKAAQENIKINAAALLAKENEKQEVATDSIANPSGKPSAVVNNFLQKINSHQLQQAYDMSNNPAWGNFSSFSNTSSGFGAVKSITVKSIKTQSQNTQQAQVNAIYEVKDKSNTPIALNTTFTLTNEGSSWKITHYKINSSQQVPQEQEKTQPTNP